MPNYQFWQKDLSPALQLVFLSSPSAVMCLPGAALALNGESVYYDTSRGLYFYLEGSNWEVAKHPSCKVGRLCEHGVRYRLAVYSSQRTRKKVPTAEGKGKKEGQKGLKPPFKAFGGCVPYPMTEKLESLLISRFLLKNPTLRLRRVYFI